jgi:O-antigen/teichoic acid export membrane protein
LTGILLGISISNIVSSVFFFRSLRIQKHDKFHDVKNNITTILHNFGTESSNYLPRFIDKLIIVPLFGLVSTGIYQLNLQILFVMELFPIALHSFLLPEESSGKIYKRIITYVVIISSLLSLFAIVLAPTFISTFFPKYSSGIESLQILLIALVPLSISSVLNAKLQAIQSKTIGYSVLIRIGSLIISIIVLGQAFGMFGMSLSVLLSISLNALYLSLIYRKSISKK